MWKSAKSQNLPIFPDKKSIWDLNATQLAWLMINVQLDEQEELLLIFAPHDEKAGRQLQRLRQGEPDDERQERQRRT